MKNYLKKSWKWLLALLIPTAFAAATLVPTTYTEVKIPARKSFVACSGIKHEITNEAYDALATAKGIKWQGEECEVAYQQWYFKDGEYKTTDTGWYVGKGGKGGTFYEKGGFETVKDAVDYVSATST